MNKHCTVISFRVIAQNVKIAQSKWLPGGHFESDINENITNELGILQNPLYLTLTKQCPFISFGVIAQNVKIAQSRWLPDGHFESDIDENIAIGLSILRKPLK